MGCICSLGYDKNLQIPPSPTGLLAIDYNNNLYPRSAVAVIMTAGLSVRNWC